MKMNNGFEHTKEKIKQFGDYLNINNMKFDVIVGNPPYNAPREKSNGDCIWPDFVEKSLSLLKPNGFLCFVHPSGWRKPGHELWSKMTGKQIHFLKIVGENESKSIFGVGTRVDWYVLQNIDRSKDTAVIDENGRKSSMDLSKHQFISNSLIDEISSLIAKNGEEKCEVIYDCSYGVNVPKEWMNDEKTSKFRYPVIHSMRRNGEIRYFYSSVKNRGHFGISKVILNDGRYVYPINDYEGKFGMTQHCFGIVVDSKEEADGIVTAINTSKFQEIIKATKWGNFATEYKMFKSFRKDFWKEFVNADGTPKA